MRPDEFELTTQPEMFIDDDDGNVGDGGAEANDIIQGDLGDCYLLSSLAILCTGQGLVDKLFVSTEFFHEGLVGLKFFKDGIWWDVAIDTLLPTLDDQAPCFARSKDANEFWMPLLEKAYAKMHGCYEALDAGRMNECLVDLTGAAPGEISIKDLFASCREGNGHYNKAKAMRLLASRSQGMLLQGASLDADDAASEELMDGGLVAGHAYSINAVKECKPHKTVLVQVCLHLKLRIDHPF